MNILFLSNWSAQEGLTQATVFPIVSALDKDSRVEKVILCTIEVKTNETVKDLGKKVIHIPLQRSGASNFFQFLDLMRFPKRIREIVRKYSIDLLWCRGAPAGGMGLLATTLSQIPFVVDSFEPHTQYMISSGTWKKSSPKFWVQHGLEYFVRKKAFALLPVSFAYYEALVDEGIDPSKLFVFPCVVNLAKFSFDEQDRKNIRNYLGIRHDTVVGIYAGKFGGLYLDHEAFQIFKHAFEYWTDNFFLIILTEMSQEVLLSRIKEYLIPLEKVQIAKVKHAEVPAYLSAADFAFSTIKPVAAMQYCSPIKHGEYWAADLPVLSTLTIGDDAKILMEEGGGYLYDIYEGDLNSIFNMLKERIKVGRKGDNVRIAVKYRTPHHVKKVINFILSR